LGGGSGPGVVSLYGLVLSFLFSLFFFLCFFLTSTVRYVGAAEQFLPCITPYDEEDGDEPGGKEGGKEEGSKNGDEVEDDRIYNSLSPPSPLHAPRWSVVEKHLRTQAG